MQFGKFRPLDGAILIVFQRLTNARFSQIALETILLYLHKHNIRLSMLTNKFCIMVGVRFPATPVSNKIIFLLDFMILVTFHTMSIQIYNFKVLFNVKLIYSIQVLGPWLWGNGSFFSSVVGQRKGPSGANAPPVHGIKKCLGSSCTF